MSSLTRAALIFASVLAVLLGVSMAPSAQAATLCDSACILQQIESLNIPGMSAPSGNGVRTVASDGSMLYYTGPNGLEIRLSHDKTTEVIKNSSDLAIAIGSFAVGGDAAAVAMKIFPAWVPQAARAAGILNQPIQDFFHIDFTTTAIKAMQRDLCLGATLEPNSVGTILSRPLKAYAAMLQGNLGGAAAAMAGIRAVWFEPCSLNRGQLSDAIKPGTLADIGLAPAPPAAAPAPVTPAHLGQDRLGERFGLDYGFLHKHAGGERLLARSSSLLKPSTSLKDNYFVRLAGMSNDAHAGGPGRTLLTWRSTKAIRGGRAPLQGLLAPRAFARIKTLPGNGPAP